MPSNAVKFWAFSVTASSSGAPVGHGGGGIRVIVYPAQPFPPQLWRRPQPGANDTPEVEDGGFSTLPLAKYRVGYTYPGLYRVSNNFPEIPVVVATSSGVTPPPPTGFIDFFAEKVADTREQGGAFMVAISSGVVYAHQRMINAWMPLPMNTT